MRENRIRNMWANGQAVVNGWLSIPSSFAAETMAHQGWDSLTVDLQHGALDYRDALSLFTAISTTDTMPVARVPWNEPGILMKVLDAGAYGVICPMINTREDAQRLVAATHRWARAASGRSAACCMAALTIPSAPTKPSSSSR